MKKFGRAERDIYNEKGVKPTKGQKKRVGLLGKKMAREKKNW